MILPYLENKKDKTFVDHYLLSDDVTGFVDPWRYSRLNMAERVFLSHRLGEAERRAAKRHLADLFALIPPNPTERDHLFATALRGRSLSIGAGGKAAGGGLGFFKNADAPVMTEELELFDRLATDDEAPPLASETHRSPRAARSKIQGNG